MDEDRSREGQAKSLGGTVACLIGLLLGLGGIVGAFLGGGPGISIGSIALLLGVLGYFLGTRRLGAITVVVAAISMFFGLAASQGLIPGMEATDRNLPAEEPRAE